MDKQMNKIFDFKLIIFPFQWFWNFTSYLASSLNIETNVKLNIYKEKLSTAMYRRLKIVPIRNLASVLPTLSLVYPHFWIDVCWRYSL